MIQIEVGDTVMLLAPKALLGVSAVVDMVGPDGYLKVTPETGDQPLYMDMNLVSLMYKKGWKGTSPDSPLGYSTYRYLRDHGGQDEVYLRIEDDSQTGKHLWLCAENGDEIALGKSDIPALITLLTQLGREWELPGFGPE